ncbi:zinc finger protein CONSTANS-LIKE 10 [Dendrobium catenatum]|uniref:Zinc finger protein CONSTANS-LIKE 10 n=1 Tax=Dendrobium catenatum TaxID=906689 RepID=A0A2I0VU63_9ASPA|nr:zinc finger protein CONSTANS-LIKE 10 [Dendrobium catenatum]XP_020675896.1 zinc finger protein CONSTANS-LIKE 10 [Dendrobium catenatum]XP_028555744.1 zinc finger protein CONSTANS-LIKE 10 [Dendrobium catenatum]PKU66945.1 Zinc finger protein CONSTANS-LIKE 10 [Dendrobium catenatum]
MGCLCDFCGGQRPMVYCRSDAASLCLACDRNVHSANALSRRHSRTLLCDRCYSQPASIRCIEESISLCQSCDWNGHGNSTSSSGHKRQTIRCYSGCPSATELARIWPFVLEFLPVEDSSCEQGIMGLLSINENSTSTHWGPPQQSSTSDMADICRMNDVEKVNTTNVHIASSSMGTAIPMLCKTDQPADSIDSTTPKSSDGRTKKVANSEDDFYDGFAVDDELTFENYEELFGASHAHSEHLFDDVGIDSIFEKKENSAANSNCQGEFVAEASSAVQVKSIQVKSSYDISVDSVMPNQGAKIDYNMSISTKQARSSLSRTFSSLTGESSASDYQDCGMSSMLLVGEPPYHPTSSDISIQAINRDNAVMRYKEKKKARMFEKKIRYASRKTRADSRRRVKGRFVKAGEAFDYDPLSQARA